MLWWLLALILFLAVLFLPSLVNGTSGWAARNPGKLLFVYTLMLWLLIAVAVACHA
jgi:hypothetical protein